MESRPRFCESCGQPVPSENAFCENCGAPVLPPAPVKPPSPPPAPPAPPVNRPYVAPPPAAASSYTPPPQPPAQPPAGYYAAYPPPVQAAPPPKPAGHSTRNIALIVLLAGGGLCVLLVLVIAVFALPKLGNQLAFLPKAATQTPLSPVQPLPTITMSFSPSATPIPTKTQAAPAPAATQPPANNSSQPASGNFQLAFSDDFSDPNSGWPVHTRTDSRIKYLPDPGYFMLLKEANYGITVIPPYHLARPIRNVLIEVRAKAITDGDAYFSVICNKTDKDNFYSVSIRGNQFLIGKQVKGNWTVLTKDFWQDLILPKKDGQGYTDVKLTCADGFIVLEVGGVGQIHLADEDLTSGDVAIEGIGGQNGDSGGVYGQVFFKDFKLSILK